MASGRALRKSPRTASPLPDSASRRTQDSVEVKEQQELRNAPAPTTDKLAPWIEPPLRDPIPSFQETPGIERGGVLEYMQPLGQFPSQRVKLRVKQYEPPKRYVQTRLMQGLPSSRDGGAGKGGPGRRRHSDSRHAEPTATSSAEISSSPATIKSELGHESGLRETSTSVLPAAPLHFFTPTMPTSPFSLHPFSHPTSFSPTGNTLPAIGNAFSATGNTFSATGNASATTAGNTSFTTGIAPSYTGNAPYESLRETIDAALARSIEKKQRTRGLAIKKLYEEGFTNPNLAELLDAILAQKASEAQQHQFQSYIKLAHKEIKAEKNHSRRSSTTIGANASVESIHNSPVSRLLATAFAPTHSSHLNLSDHHPSLDISPLHRHTSSDQYPSSTYRTFRHHNTFPDKDTPLASLEGGVPLSPTLLESNTDIMPPRKRPADRTEAVSSKRAKLNNGKVSKDTLNKPNGKKRSALKGGDVPNGEPSTKRIKRDASTASQESALTEMDSDGLKDLEAVATKEVSPRASVSAASVPASSVPVLSAPAATVPSSSAPRPSVSRRPVPGAAVDQPYGKGSTLMPCNQKNIASFLAPPEREQHAPMYVVTKATREENAKENGRPTRTRIPTKKASETAELQRMNLLHFPKDHLSLKDLDEMKKSLRRENLDYKVEKSDIRTPTTDHSAQPSPAPNAPAITLANTAQQETNNVASASSSDAGDFLVPPPPGALRISTRSSRAQTPRAASPAKTTRTTRNGTRAARMKNSPKKQKLGVTAGLAPSSVGNNSGSSRVLGNAQAELDNNEYCSACGGEGEVLCCDGCPRSFHFTCLDPPMTTAPEGQWFCHVCTETRAPQAAPSSGIFGPLLGNVGKGNPVAFSLPADIRTFFEGVETGEAGEYQELAAPLKRGKRARADAERECADYGQLKGVPILCAACGGNSRKGERLFLPCDFCSLHWHLDCLDPPMANPPAGRDGRPAPPWKCPSHVDADFLNATRKAEEGATGRRVIKVRRPKNARIVDAPAVNAQAQPAARNNGIIEIELEPSDDESPPIDMNVVQRMTEEGVKLDFIKLVKSKNDAYSRRSSATELTQTSAADKEATDRESMPPPPPRKRSKTGHSPVDALSQTDRENMRLGEMLRHGLLPASFTTMDSAERDAVVMLAALGTPTSFGAASDMSLASPITTDASPSATTPPTAPTDVGESTNANAVTTAITTNAVNTVLPPPPSPTSSTTKVADSGSSSRQADAVVGSIDAGTGPSTAHGSTTRESSSSAPNGTIVVADATAAAPPSPPPPAPATTTTTAAAPKKSSRAQKHKVAAEPARKSTRAKKGRVPA